MAIKPKIKVTGVDKLLSEIGIQLSDVVSQAIQVGFQEGLAASRQLADRHAPASQQPAVVPQGERKHCIVPECHRVANAKGLCPAHYLKARRLVFDTPFSSKQLALLAEDGRKQRFHKKDAGSSSLD